MSSLLVGKKGVQEIGADEQVDLEKLPLGQESSTQIEDASLAVKPVDSPTSGFLGLSEEWLGLLALGTVPIVWGSYVPVVRGLYEIDPPIPGFVFSTAYFAVAAVSSFGLLAWQNTRKDEDATLTPQVSEDENKFPFRSVLAGAELGFYLFLGNSLQVIGYVQDLRVHRAE
jgi:hypothetical protein